jgi:hypothetical protein
VLLRLAYLGVTNVFALMRLLPVSSRDKDAEILVPRHHLLLHALREFEEFIKRAPAASGNRERPPAPATARAPGGS